MIKLTVVAVGLIGIFGGNSIVAQATNDEKLLFQEVWKPFCEAYANCDSSAFMNLHHPNAKRVIRENNVILNKSEYARNFRSGCTYLNDNQLHRTLALRFIQSVVDVNNAFQEGIYKSSYYAKDNSVTQYYGKFHVLLTKENGKWLILMDADTPTSVKPEDFDNLQPIK